MTPLAAITALIFAMIGEIKYPAICIPKYLSDENTQSAKRVEEALFSRPDCIKIGEETITEGDRTGKTFSIFTCCKPAETDKE